MSQFSQAARDSINKLSQKDHQVKNWGFPNYVPARRGIPMHRMPLMETNQKFRLIHYQIPWFLKMDRPSKHLRTDKSSREEIFELFNREVYGRVPENIPSVNWKVVNRNILH